MSYKARRIVTAEREDGSSYILNDGEVDATTGIPGVLEITELWSSDETPARIPITNDVISGPPETLEPTCTGNKLVVEVAWPDKDPFDPAKAKEMFDSIKAPDALSRKEGQKYPGMHRTNTVDYVVILFGEIWLIVDDKEILVKQGDVVVQGGVNHTWVNRSDAPCVLLAVLVGAERG